MSLAGARARLEPCAPRPRRFRARRIHEPVGRGRRDLARRIASAGVRLVGVAHRAARGIAAAPRGRDPGEAGGCRRAPRRHRSAPRTCAPRSASPPGRRSSGSWSPPDASLAELLAGVDVRVAVACAVGFFGIAGGVRFLRGAGADAPAPARTVERASTDNFGHADWMSIAEARRSSLATVRKRAASSSARPTASTRTRARTARSIRAIPQVGTRRAGAAVDL